MTEVLGFLLFVLIVLGSRPRKKCPLDTEPYTGRYQREVDLKVEQFRREMDDALRDAMGVPDD